MLDELSIKDTYSSSVSSNDLILEFYNPVLECAVQYDRITGFFSPAVLSIASRGFAGLISTGGKIRLITSVQLDDRAYKAIVENGEKLDDELLDDFDFDSVKHEIDKDYLSVFAWLYRKGQLEMKIAITNKDRSMLHQKIGIVTDADGNSISFSGSNNETPNGWQHNIEQFKVFKSWNPHTLSFYDSDQKEFDMLWNNLSSKARVVDVDSAIKDKLIQRIERHRKDNISTVVKRIKKHEHINKMRIVAAKKPVASQAPEAPSVVSKSSRELRDYQVSAINHWVDHGYTSIFEMATGTGKTFTAINALKKFKENKSYLRAVVVVPLTTLTVQWQEDIKKVLPDINIINTSVNAKWKDELNNIIFSKDLGRDLDYVLVTTYSMFSKDDFGERLGRLGDDIILLADEMHNLVNSNRIKALANPIYKYKLGLSATPTRLWQPTESAIAKLHFGDNSYQYSLADAIKNEFLVPYNYHPLPTYLTAEEYDEYLELSKEIARMSQVKTSESDGSSALHMKLIARSRIKKNAENKIFSLEKTLRDIQNSGGLQNALIYVDNEEYLQGLQEMLTRNNIRTTKFVGNNSLEERLSAIQNLRTQSINAIVAIKCLDEGVDIPSAQIAFFISNNTDPREYVQRLGRVLRLDEVGGKEKAEIYDYIVMPPQDVVYESEMDRRIARNMIKNELIRARFFNELAINSSSAKELIDDAVDRYGFYYEDDELTYSIGDEDNELTY